MKGRRGMPLGRARRATSRAGPEDHVKKILNDVIRNPNVIGLRVEQERKRASRRASCSLNEVVPVDARMREREPELEGETEPAGANNEASEERKALTIIALVAFTALAGFLWLVA